MSAPGEAGSRICRNTTSVKVQTFMGTGAVPCTETRQKFPVLVRVTAAAAEEQISSATPHGVDIVAVLDVSMSADKLKRTKDAMNIVINKLGPEDRLSIVSFGSDDVRREMELTGMSDHQGRKDAKDVVKRLLTQGGASSMGRRVPLAALHEGAQILRERQDGEKSSSRVGCILFLSDGLDTQILDDACISSDFPVHTLGLGADHDPKALKHIADKTSGTYSFANKDMAKIKDACALFTSIPATSVEITLRAHEGALISSNETGPDDGRSLSIRIDNMYAGEKRNFIVYLALEATAEGRQKLLTIGGRYQNLSESKNLDDTDDVFLMRPDEKSSKTGRQVFLRVPDVAAQIKMLFLGISGSVPQPTAATITSRLQQIWQDVCHSTEGKIRNASETMGNIKEAGYQKMTRGINNFDRYKVSGLPYKLSWPRSLNWRRATTKNNEPESPKTGDVVLTPGQEPEEIAQDGNHGNAATTAAATWEKIRARARRHPCSRLRPGVAVVLVLTSLLLMMLYSGLEGSSMAKGIAQLQYPMLLFSKSNYAAWDANKAIDPKQVPARKDQEQLAWKATKATDESTSPGQGCCRDNADDASDKCGECHGRDHDTDRESDLVAKILDIILSSVKGKESELKSLLVEARCDHE
ncbi:hypothetical protein SETIT_7G278500v2 [Setaria italica]|uniref:VWFA domain-containing protein n=1 Tax=Setaria italica TaxID=4555 RepID=A0A368S0G9_SETIT|nr:uncharacterized protein LOC111258042 [Setaria italica]RCV35926.1 hypothetical protein SETIT_7G278500v2 [Setaria italica]